MEKLKPQTRVSKGQCYEFIVTKDGWRCFALAFVVSECGRGWGGAGKSGHQLALDVAPLVSLPDEVLHCVAWDLHNTIQTLYGVVWTIPIHTSIDCLMDMVDE